MKKRALLYMTVLLLCTCLSHFPAVNGEYGPGMPYHPFRLFSLDAAEVEGFSFGNGRGGFVDYAAEEEVERVCETLNGFRYLIFIPDHLPGRGGWSSAFRIDFADGGYQWVHVRPGCFSVRGVGWWFGFGGGSKEFSKMIDAIGF